MPPRKRFACRRAWHIHAGERRRGVGNKGLLNGTCMVTTGGTPPPTLAPGQFRVIGQPIQWDATYFSTPQQFWVSQGGMNMATTQLSTANGDLGGSFNLPLGLWYISARTALMGPGNYFVFGPNVKGDPHITTMDGKHYDFQGAGEFTLLKNVDAGFEVQSLDDAGFDGRAFAAGPTLRHFNLPKHQHGCRCQKPGASIFLSAGNRRQCPVAAHATAHRWQSRRRPCPGNDPQRRHQDQPQSGKRGTPQIRLRNGWGVRIVPNWWSATGLWYLDYDFTPATSATGIAGPIARDSWLPALSDGNSVGRSRHPPATV